MEDPSVMICVQLGVGVICGIICAAIASSKGRSAVGWFFVGMFTGIIGIIIIAVLSNTTQDQAYRYQIDMENRRLREQVRQERIKADAFRQHAQRRLDAHDQHMGIDTRSNPQLEGGSPAPAGYLEGGTYPLADPYAQAGYQPYAQGYQQPYPQGYSPGAYPQQAYPQQAYPGYPQQPYPQAYGQPYQQAAPYPQATVYSPGDPAAQAGPQGGAPGQQGAPGEPVPPVGASGPLPLTEATWYYEISGQTQGPVTAAAILAMLASKQLSGSSLLWCDELVDWTPAKKLPQFK